MPDFAALFEARLKTVPDLLVYDGEAPTGKDEPENYVVYYTTTPRQETARLSADHSMRGHTISTMCVGKSPWQVRETAKVVHAALTRHRLATAAEPIRLGTAGQVRDDSTVNPRKWIVTDVWRFNAPA